jgi:hypothetical protein
MKGDWQSISSGTAIRNALELEGTRRGFSLLHILHKEMHEQSKSGPSIK